MYKEIYSPPPQPQHLTLTIFRAARERERASDALTYTAIEYNLNTTLFLLYKMYGNMLNGIYTLGMSFDMKLFVLDSISMGIVL